MLRHYLKTGWRECLDVEGVPRYLRCCRCYTLVTHGQVRTGGCVCGWARFNPAIMLTALEALLLKVGWFPLNEQERQRIEPFFTRVGDQLRSRLLRPV